MATLSPPTAGAPETRLTRRIILLSAAAFSSTLSTRMSDPILPQLADTFDITIGTAAQAVSAYAFAYGIVLLVYGPLGDRYGKFRVIALTTLASLFGALGSAIAINFEWLTACRFLSGATAASLIPLSMAWIGDNVPYERRQQVLAFFLTGQIFGLVSGQALGGLFSDVAGWRSVFYFQSATYLIVGINILLEVRRSPDIDQRIGHLQAPQSFASQLSSVLHSPWPQQILLTVCLEGMFLFSALAFLPSFLHKTYGISLTTAGFSMGMFGIGGLCYTTFARHFIKRFGERGLALTGGLLLSLAFTTLILSGHWLWALPVAWCAGLGYYMMHNTLQTNATQMAPAMRGTAVSLFAAFFFTGQSFGVWLASLTADHFGFYPVFGAAALTLPIIGTCFFMRLRTKPAA